MHIRAHATNFICKFESNAAKCTLCLLYILYVYRVKGNIKPFDTQHTSYIYFIKHNNDDDDDEKKTTTQSFTTLTILHSINDSIL